MITRNVFSDNHFVERCRTVARTPESREPGIENCFNVSNRGICRSLKNISVHSTTGANEYLTTPASVVHASIIFRQYMQHS